jgi:hypothetical protein
LKYTNGVDTDRNIIGVDWSRAEVDIYDSSTDSYHTFPNLESAAKAFPGTIFVLESTGESFELQRREVVLEAFKQYDIDARCSNTKYTAQFRMKNDVAKTNASDAKVLYRIFTETKLSWSRFSVLVESDPIREKIQKFLVEDRYLHDKKNTQKLTQKYLSKSIVPGEFQEFIIAKAGKKKTEYRKPVGSILAVAEGVRVAKGGYRVFRRQLGNHGQGYGSMPRSEFYWWWVRIVLNKRIKEQGIEKKFKMIPDAKTGQPKKLRQWSDVEKGLKKQSMKDAVKAARYLWRIVLGS